MKPPGTASSEKALPSPTAPPEVRRPLLQLAAKGISTADAAEKLRLPALTVRRYLERLRVAGDVHLRATEDGRDAEWVRTNGRRKA